MLSIGLFFKASLTFREAEIPFCTQYYPIVSKCTKMFPNVAKSTKSTKCSQMYPNVSKCTQKYQNASKCSRVPLFWVLSFHKCTQMHPSGGRADFRAISIFLLMSLINGHLINMYMKSENSWDRKKGEGEGMKSKNSTQKKKSQKYLGMRREGAGGGG